MFYYKVWMDCIRRGKSQPGNQKNWKLIGMLLMSMAMSFNLMVVVVVLQKLVAGQFYYRINLPGLPPALAGFIGFLLLFFLPPFLLNYLLIFRNKRYERLLHKYPYYQGKLFLVYFIISVFLPITLLWIAIAFFK